jgi:hypothetical protein
VHGAIGAAVACVDRPSIVIARTDIFGRLACIPQTVDGHFIKLDDALTAAMRAELQGALDDA